MDLDSLVRQVEGFAAWGPTDKIKFFAWYLHDHASKPHINADDVRKCFATLRIEVPNISSYFRDLEARKPAQLLHDKNGYFLERAVADRYRATYGNRAITVEVLDALASLPDKLPDLGERAYLAEALVCFRHQAFRASAIMCWNLAYDHLCNHVLTKKLADFQTAYASKYPKEKVVVSTRDDFHELKERDVLEACRIGGITTKNVSAVLIEKLNIRNRVAHASGASFLQPQAEAYILDLLNNAVLKF